MPVIRDRERVCIWTNVPVAALCRVPVKRHVRGKHHVMLTKSVRVPLGGDPCLLVSYIFSPKSCIEKTQVNRLTMKTLGKQTNYMVLLT